MRMNGVQEVGGSNPLAPTIWGLSFSTALYMGVFSVYKSMDKIRVQLRWIVNQVF